MNSHRTLAAVVLLATSAFALTGCGALPEDRATGSESRTLTVQGVERDYRLYVPAELDTDRGLVVMMHGGLGSARQAERAYGWNDEADAGGFIVAYPEGENRVWNAGECCGRSDADDLAFITALVAGLQDEFGIAAERTFATGAIAANTSVRQARVYAIIAPFDIPVAGTIVTPCEDPSALSVLHIHGLDDGKVRMDGEQGDGPGNVDGLPIADVNARWRDAAGCPDPTTTAEPPVTTTTSECGAFTVTLITVADAGHQWPGSVGREGASDQPVDTLDATAVIWEFFAAA